MPHPTTATHLIVPFAHADMQGCEEALSDLRLPHLSLLADRWQWLPMDRGESSSWAMPHERTLARAWGWRADGPTLAWAAAAAQSDGIDTGNSAWGLITPNHWQLGREHITMLDPEELNLSEPESRAFFETVRGLFESAGVQLTYGAPLRWYAAHESLAALPCPSLDRVIYRNIDPWMPSHPNARLMKRLQSEVQILLQQSSLNDAREECSAYPVNSFWLSGCGRHQPQVTRCAVQVLDTLRKPALQGNWSAWAAAWKALDEEFLATLHERSDVTLTLCGEQSAQSLVARATTPIRRWCLSVSARWRAPAAHLLLKNL